MRRTFALLALLSLFPASIRAASDLKGLVESQWIMSNNAHDENIRNAIIDELFADDFESLGMGGTVDHGVDALKHFLSDVRTKISGYQISVLDIARDNNKVWLRIQATGEHVGPLLGKAGTGKSISVQTMVVLEFRDSKIVREWLMTDLVALMNQIGVGFAIE